MGYTRHYTINLSEILLPRQPEPALKLRLLNYEIREIHGEQIEQYHILRDHNQSIFFKYEQYYFKFLVLLVRRHSG